MREADRKFIVTGHCDICYFRSEHSIIFLEESASKSTGGPVVNEASHLIELSY